MSPAYYTAYTRRRETAKGLRASGFRLLRNEIHHIIALKHHYIKTIKRLLRVIQHGILTQQITQKTARCVGKLASVKTKTNKLGTWQAV